MTPHTVSDSDGEPDDERHLYGEPQHEVPESEDPDETLYGTPQHETSKSLPDFELFRLDNVAFEDDRTGRFDRTSHSRQSRQTGYSDNTDGFSQFAHQKGATVRRVRL
ncbi:hypothetical protein [Haladaptatus cibarius]|uniref:hypothetical protein n=1 Tax=Haladaptatus cibarius TaxID=453847 RepID=UPI000679CC64|nr:hypothetical protein [Haladaptatus cibarius]